MPKPATVATGSPPSAPSLTRPRRETNSGMELPSPLASRTIFGGTPAMSRQPLSCLVSAIDAPTSASVCSRIRARSTWGNG